MPKPIRRLIISGAMILTAAGCTATTNNITQHNVTQQVVVANVQAGGGLPVGSVLACSHESTLKSISSTQRILVTFQNQMETNVKLFWLGYDGQRKVYADIAPGQSHRSPTFITHPWLVADKDGKCLEIVLPGRDTQNVTIHTSSPHAATASPMTTP